MNPIEKAITSRKASLAQARKVWAKGVEAPLSSLNEWAAQDRGVKGPTWVRQVTLPAPEDDVRQALYRAMDEIRPGVTYQMSSVIETPAEWVGARPVQPDNAHRVQDPIAEDAPTVFYVHGGGFTSGSPSQARSTTSRIAQATRARVFAPKYRLAPTYTMPTQLLDIIVAYFSLLNPPADALHDPIPANRLVVVADSCGAALSLSLLAFLLRLTRNRDSKLRFNGHTLPRSIIPAGFAFISPLLTSCYQLPHFFDQAYTANDVLPEENPLYYSRRPDEPRVWPSAPPREHWLCSKDLLLHPLAEPMLLPEEHWRGAPPVWAAVGQERAAPAMELLLVNMSRAGVRVRMDVFEGMCHIWHVMLPRSPSAAEGMKRLHRMILELSRSSSEAVDGQKIVVEEVTLLERKSDWMVDFTGKELWERWITMVREKNRDLPVYEGHARMKGRL